MNQIYVSLETNPYFNVAAEYQLFKESGPDPCLFLWQNRSSVIVGRNQNVFAECDTNFLKEHGIVPVRRFSGGGAVFQDMGNVNFTFLSSEDHADIERYLKVLESAMLSLGVECTFSGRNDLLAGGKKFSGHARFADCGRLMYHGTIMISVNMDLLAGALKPSYLKLNSKGIHSVRSRVVNLSELNGDITPTGVKEAMIKAFAAEYGAEVTVKHLSRENMKPSLFEKIKKDGWIYGEAPDFNLSFEKKLSFGNVSVSADISDGIISRLRIYTDSLVTADFTPFEKEWTGSFFDEKMISDKLEQFICQLMKKE